VSVLKNQLEALDFCCKAILTLRGGGMEES
jgi:hypothetical protein